MKRMLLIARPQKSQLRDIDFLLALGQMFTLVVYGQLVLENGKINNIDDDTIDQIFEFMVRDFSNYALQLRDKSATTRLQQWHCGRIMRRPAIDTKRFNRVWENQVYAMRSAYAMKE